MSVGAEDGEWVTLPEAADKLGVSVITLRRRLKDGVLEGKQIPSRHGPQWLIRVADDAQPAPPLVVGTVEEADNGHQLETTHAPETDQALINLELLRLVDKLHEENRNLAGQLGFSQAQLLQLQAQLALAEEKMKVLEAPRPTANPSEAPPELPEKVEERAQALPWWRSWWRLFAS